MWPKILEASYRIKGCKHDTTNFPKFLEPPTHRFFKYTKSDREIRNYLEGSISHEYLMLSFKSHLGHRIKRPSYTNMGQTASILLWSSLGYWVFLIVLRFWSTVIRVNNFSLPVALAADDDENCSWILAMGMIIPLTLQFCGITTSW